MKIVRLTAENVKKLRAVEITPTGELVEISGRNGSGKTSVLDSIWWALAGTKHIQAVPIRKGANKARIRLDLGELVVERRFSDAGSTLTVESADGARYKSPQSMLDALLGALAFDPLAFVGQEAREQFATLRRLVPLDVDLDKLDALSRGDYDRRTELNRQAKALRAQADAVPVSDAALPAAPLDTAALKDQMTAAAQTNVELEQRKARREQAARDIQAKREEGERARARATSLRAEAVAMDAMAEAHARAAGELEEKLRAAAPLPAPVDADRLRAQLDRAEATNQQIERRERKAALLADAAALEAQAHELTETMDAREQTKAAAIASAAMPVEGLGFGNDVVTYDGVPFDQAETSAQIRVGVALAMAMNPKLRVIRIKEGSFLDSDNLALIAAMAREHDYQIWIERVDTSGKIGVVIEDGSVVAVNGEPVGAAAEGESA